MHDGHQTPQYQTADPLYYDLLRQFAIENRNHQTEAEMILWKALRNNKVGLHFRRQHIVGRYIADFACIKAMLIIEVDGGYHAQYQQIIDDYLRTEELERIGFKVLRFTNEEILKNLSYTLDKIYESIIFQITNGK